MISELVPAENHFMDSGPGDDGIWTFKDWT